MVILTIIPVGCGPVAGNYPPDRWARKHFSAKFEGPGFQMQAGSRVPVEKVEAELGSLRDQGYSRHDPQIIKSVARRSNVPPGLLADRSGCAYYRMTVQLKPGVGINLDPGALEMTVATATGTMVIYDQGYLLEDRRRPEGCREPSGSLVLGSPAALHDQITEFLVRLPVRGEIVSLDLVPTRFRRLTGPDRARN
jgi:hypothetical protein